MDIENTIKNLKWWLVLPLVSLLLFIAITIKYAVVFLGKIVYWLDKVNFADRPTYPWLDKVLRWSDK